MVAGMSQIGAEASFALQITGTCLTVISTAIFDMP